MLMWVALFLCGLSLAAEAKPRPRGPLFYQRPPVVILKLVATGKTIPGKDLDLMAMVEGQLGTTSNLKISFDSSKDIQVENPGVQLPALKAGETHKIRLTARWDPQKLTTESCVRMVLEYTPDTEKLLEAVSDAATFPDPFKRKALADKIRNEAAKDARKVETVEYFPFIDQYEDQ